MSVLTRLAGIACAIGLAALPVFSAEEPWWRAGGKDWLVVYVAYDPAAPLDGARSYACVAVSPADPSHDAHRAGRLPLACRNVALADLCGVTGAGDSQALDPGCPLVPGASAQPSAEQVRQFSAALAGYFQGNLPKLNFTLLDMSAAPGNGFRANLRTAGAGASPAVGAWDAAAPAERAALAMPLMTIDPAQPDARFGNSSWVNPHGREWGAYLPAATLDHVERVARNALATTENPVPSPAAVAARAAQEVTDCRGSSIGLLRADIRSHIGRLSGRAAARPAVALPRNCLVDPGPPPPPRPQQRWTATKTCGGETRTFTSAVSQADAERKARAWRCSVAPTSPPSAPKTWRSTKTCGSETRTFTSTASQADADRKASAWRCPTYTATASCPDGSSRTYTASTQSAANAQAANHVCRTYWATDGCGKTHAASTQRAADAAAARVVPAVACPTSTGTTTGGKSGGTGPRTRTCPDDSKVPIGQACPTYRSTASCPDGSSRTYTASTQEAADNRAAIHVCRTYTARDCKGNTHTAATPEAATAAAGAVTCRWTATDCYGNEHVSTASPSDAERKARAVKCRWTATASCDDGSSKTYTASTQRAADAQAASHVCRTYRATDGCGKTHTASTQSAADAAAARVDPDVACPAPNPPPRQCPSGYVTNGAGGCIRLSSGPSSGNYDVRDGGCDSADPDCVTPGEDYYVDRGRRCPDGSRVSTGQSCPTYTARASCPDGSSRTYTASTQRAASAAAGRHRCRTYTARDCKGRTHRASTQSAASAAARAVKCSVVKPSTSRRTYRLAHRCGTIVSASTLSGAYRALSAHARYCRRYGLR